MTSCVKRSQGELKQRGVAFGVRTASNPEFLKEGFAVADFMKPDRIIVGVNDEDQRSIEALREMYTPFNRNRDRLVVMDVRSAEFTKYAANCMLAVRISFMNELANLSEKLGVDIEHVRQGIGSDPRIGPQFLYAGAGFGGSCFPKDLRALIHTADKQRQACDILKAAVDVNTRQRRVIAEKIRTHFEGDLTGRTIALWGLAFKANTDDMREASSVAVIDELTKAGARVVAYDPVAMPNAREQLAGNALRDDGSVRARCGRRRRRPGGDHRVARVPQPEFRVAGAHSEGQGRLRRPQPVRADDRAGRGPHLLRNRARIAFSALHGDEVHQ